MQRQITRGAAANAGLIFHVFAMDSASAVGAGKASVAFSSWSCRYIRNGEAISGAITPEDVTTIGTYAAPTANTNIRIKAVDNTNMIGVYEVHVHLDWVNVTNSCQSLTIYLTASGVAVLPIQVPLTGFDLQAASTPQTGDSFARIGVAGAGLTNIDLPNQTMDITGSLSGSVGSVTGAVGSVTGNVGGNVVGSVASVTAGVTLAASAVQAIWDALTSALTTVGSIGKKLADWTIGTAQTGDSFARLGAPAGASVSADVAAVKGDTAATLVDTAEIGTAGAGLTNINLPNQTMDIVGSITGNLSGSVGSVSGAVGSVTGNIGGNVVGSVASVTAGVTLAASAVQAIWDALTSALTTAGSIGKLLVDNINATISSRLASASYTTPPTVGEIADQVWDEAIAGHAGAGSTGAALSAAGSAGDPWTTALPGAYGAGTAGKIVGDNLNATVGSRASQVTLDAVQADADNIQTRLPAALVSGRIDASVGAVATDALTAAALAADAVAEIQSGLSTLTAAGVRTAVGLASANLDTQLDALPTAAEVATAVSAPSAAAIADAVWDEDATAHQTQGTFGQAIGDPGADADTIFGLVNTNLDAAVSTRLASAGYTVPPTVIAIRQEVDANSTKLDVATSTRLATVGYTAPPTADQNADALLDRAAGVETNRTPRQAMRLMLAALAGKLSGAATTTAVIRDTNDSKDRITATVDASGNRTAVTLDAS